MRIESKNKRSHHRYEIDESRPFISRMGRRIITVSASLLVTTLLMVMPQLEVVEQELVTLLVILPIAFMGVYRLLQIGLNRDRMSPTADVPVGDLVKATIQEVYREWDETMAARNGIEDETDYPMETDHKADNASPVASPSPSPHHIDQLDT